MDNLKLEESYGIMRDAAQRAKEAETPLLINFSGGKDSSCLVLLAQDLNIPVELNYMISGLELPGSIDFVLQAADKFKMKLHLIDPVIDYQGDFAYWVRRRGYFPARGYTYCSSRLKLRPSRAYFRKIFGFKPLYRVNGVRMAESPRRAKLYVGKEPIRKDKENSGHYLVQPILNWTGADVKEYLQERNFIPPKHYDDFGVSGCAYCPFYQVDIYHRILNEYPDLDVYNNIIALEKEIGKPSVAGNKFLYEIKENFLANREEIMAQLNSKEIKNKK